jgi:outer membrane protein assembly factor BamE (lipoprotein component of BamABCDE complex)
MLEEKNKELFVNIDNKNDVIKKLGPPSIKSSFDDNVMFYIERKITTKSMLKLGKREIITNNVLIVEIDNRGILTKKAFFDLNEMNDLDIEKKITEVDYTKTSFIYDFLSSMRQKINDPLGKRSRSNN